MVHLSNIAGKNVIKKAHKAATALNQLLSLTDIKNASNADAWTNNVIIKDISDFFIVSSLKITHDIFYYTSCVI